MAAEIRQECFYVRKLFKMGIHNIKNLIREYKIILEIPDKTSNVAIIYNKNPIKYNKLKSVIIQIYLIKHFKIIDFERLISTHSTSFNRSEVKYIKDLLFWLDHFKKHDETFKIFKIALGKRKFSRKNKKGGGKYYDSSSYMKKMMINILAGAFLYGTYFAFDSMGFNLYNIIFSFMTKRGVFMKECDGLLDVITHMAGSIIGGKRCSEITSYNQQVINNIHLLMTTLHATGITTIAWTWGNITEIIALILFRIQNQINKKKQTTPMSKEQSLSKTEYQPTFAEVLYNRLTKPVQTESQAQYSPKSPEITDQIQPQSQAQYSPKSPELTDQIQPQSQAQYSPESPELTDQILPQVQVQGQAQYSPKSPIETHIDEFGEDLIDEVVDEFGEIIRDSDGKTQDELVSEYEERVTSEYEKEYSPQSQTSMRSLRSQPIQTRSKRIKGGKSKKTRKSGKK